MIYIKNKNKYKKIRNKVQILNNVYFETNDKHCVHEVIDEFKKKTSSNIDLKVRLDNIKRILTYIVSIKKINQNQMVLLKISFFDCLSKIKNIILTNGTFPQKM